MKTDNIFYKIFATFPHLFFELTGKPQRDPSQYGFKSVTVKETELRMDGLFLPSAADPQAPLYFVEVQFQPESNLDYRLMAEIHLYLRQYQPGRPWQAVVFYPSETIDEGLPVEYQALDRIVIQRVYLKELREDNALSPEVGIVRLVVETPKRAEPWARQLIESSRQVPAETQRSRLSRSAKLL